MRHAFKEVQRILEVKRSTKNILLLLGTHTFVYVRSCSGLCTCMSMSVRQEDTDKWVPVGNSYRKIKNPSLCNFSAINIFYIEYLSSKRTDWAVKQ